VTVTDISPLPKVNHFGPRKRKAQKAEVLTSSPYKRQLEEGKQKKVELEQARSRRLKKKELKEKSKKESEEEKRRKPTKKLTTSNSRNTKVSTSGKKSSLAFGNEQYLCLYCHDLYTDPPMENWIQHCECQSE